jgi:methyltransferase (TIGR00027 family)
MGAALARAAHREQDPPPWILDDPIARELLPEAVLARFASARFRLAPALSAAIRAVFAVRARLAEDVAVAGLAENRSDYVLLGAGLDTFAWRHALASSFTVWEIDHPDTQAWKRQRLAQIGLSEPSNVNFAPVDRGTTTLETVSLPRRATWNWLGVTVYLDKATTAATLATIAKASETAVVVVDFALTPDYCDELGITWREDSARFAGSVGEHHASLFSPDEACRLVSSAGFDVIEALGAADLSARYLGHHPELRMPGANIYLVARTTGS